MATNSFVIRPRVPALNLALSPPNAAPSELHPAHQVPVSAPVNPATLISADAGNAIELGGDGRLYAALEQSQSISHVHTQSPAAAVWVVLHQLGKYPSVTVVDSAGDGVYGDVDYVDANSLTITFSAAFSGKAFIN